MKGTLFRIEIFVAVRQLSSVIRGSNLIPCRHVVSETRLVPTLHLPCWYVDETDRNSARQRDAPDDGAIATGTRRAQRMTGAVRDQVPRDAGRAIIAVIVIQVH